MKATLWVCISTERIRLEIQIWVDKVDTESIMSEKSKVQIIKPWGSLKCRDGIISVRDKD